MPCKVEAARERLELAAITVAELVSGDPDGAVLDAAVTEYIFARNDYAQCWKGDPDARQA